MTGLNVEPSLNRNHCPITNLVKGERLLVTSLRRWLFDPKALPRIARRFHHDLGYGPGRLAVENFCEIVTLLETNARRTVYLRYPNCSKVSTDERTIIALIAAAQHNHRYHVAALARWLFPPASQDRAISHITMLAIALRDGGCILARPTARNPNPETYMVALKAVV
jgi:hypothetical protein